MTEWQPIETAPRDGRYVLLLVASEYTEGAATYHIASWDEGWPSRGPRDPGQLPCWWANENGARYYEPYVQKWMALPEKVPLDPVLLLEMAVGVTNYTNFGSVQ